LVNLDGRNHTFKPRPDWRISVLEATEAGGRRSVQALFALHLVPVGADKGFLHCFWSWSERTSSKKNVFGASYFGSGRFAITEKADIPALHETPRKSSWPDQTPKLRHRNRSGGNWKPS